MPGIFTAHREISKMRNCKSKGKIERETLWGNKVKGSSAFRKGVACSQLDRDELLLHVLNRGTLVYSQTEGQGPPGKPLSIVIIIKAR